MACLSCSYRLMTQEAHSVMHFSNVAVNVAMNLNTTMSNGAAGVRYQGNVARQGTHTLFGRCDVAVRPNVT